MKIDHDQLGEVFLNITLDQFRTIPNETEVDHKFSHPFQNNIRSISKKSKSITWRIWQVPVKRLILIVLLVMIILTTISCATPAIRSAIINFLVVEDDINFGITFDPDAAANVPCVIEELYIPTNPEGYTLVCKNGNDSGVELIWMNKNAEYIHYSQSIIQENATNSTWIGIDAEKTSRTNKIINGYLVEAIIDEANNKYVAVWTDNRYIYVVDISVVDSEPEPILEMIMNSLTEVETIE